MDTHLEPSGRRLARCMKNLVFFFWHTKDLELGGCSVGFGRDRWRWYRREMRITGRPEDRLVDFLVDTEDVPEEVLEAYKGYLLNKNEELVS